MCATPAEAHADLAATVAELQPILRRRHLALIGTGVHPFSSWNRLRLTEDDRYARLVDKIQWPARRMMIHGVHFHVGVPSGDHAIAVTNALTNLLPHFVALSASSPYWFGDDTGLASMRTKVFESMPSASLPPELTDWADFERLVEILVRAGTIETVKELWWDIRPSPGWGTVELRMCDGMATLTELCALAALAQAAVAYLCQRIDAGEQFDPRARLGAAGEQVAGSEVRHRGHARARRRLGDPAGRRGGRVGRAGPARGAGAGHRGGPRPGARYP